MRESASPRPTVQPATDPLSVDERIASLQATLDALRRTQAQVVRDQKLEAIGALAAGLAHELNTPAQYVGDNVAFLLRACEDYSAIVSAALALTAAHYADTDPTPELAALRSALRRARLDFLVPQVPLALEAAREGVARIAHIVAALQNFSHPGAETKELVDLRQSVETAVTLARGEWKYVAEVLTDFDDALGAVPALRDELNQVILSLVLNAAHAIGERARREAADGRGIARERRGTIRIVTRREGEWAILTVSDDGTGMPEGVVARIFEPFFTTKPVGHGGGQGLAMVYNVVVERHGGRIDVETELGRGSTFVVRLPLAAASRAGNDTTCSGAARGAE